MSLSSLLLEKFYEIPDLTINLTADWDCRSPSQHEQEAELVGITMCDSHH